MEFFAFLRLSWTLYWQIQRRNSLGSTRVTKISKVQKNWKKIPGVFVCVRKKSLQCSFYQKWFSDVWKSCCYATMPSKINKTENCFCLRETHKWKRPYKKLKVEVHHWSSRNNIRKPHNSKVQAYLKKRRKRFKLGYENLWYRQNSAKLAHFLANSVHSDIMLLNRDIF